MNIEKDDLLALVQQGYTHIPLVMETLADLDTPVSTYLKLANAPYTYLFESVIVVMSGVATRLSVTRG